MFKILWEFKELIATAVVIGILVAGVMYIRHGLNERAELKAIIERMNAEHKLERQAWTAEVEKWNAEVRRIEKELQDIQKKKEQVIKKERKSFNDVFKKTETIEKNIQNEIKANVRLRSDVVSVPAEFVRYYHAAVEGSRIAAEGGDIRNAQDSVGIQGEVVSYDATTFTEVVVGNALACVDLAVRHNALVNVVEQLEALHGNNAARTDGKAEEGRGDVSDRALEAIF